MSSISDKWSNNTNKSNKNISDQSDQKMVLTGCLTMSMPSEALSPTASATMQPTTIIVKTCLCAAELCNRNCECGNGKRIADQFRNKGTQREKPKFAILCLLIVIKLSSSCKSK